MVPFPRKKYQIIYADPPWPYDDKVEYGNYHSMSIKDLCKLPIKKITDDNAVLFMWAVYPMLKEAFQVIESWGFQYKTIAFQWVKLNPRSGGYFLGLGRWTRGNTEPCFLGVKGKPKTIAGGISQIVEFPRGVHSKKPYIIREKIVKLMGDLPRIELFARPPKNVLFEDSSYKGWDLWGNEV